MGRKCGLLYLFLVLPSEQIAALQVLEGNPVNLYGMRTGSFLEPQDMVREAKTALNPPTRCFDLDGDQDGKPKKLSLCLNLTQETAWLRCMKAELSRRSDFKDQALFFVQLKKSIEGLPPKEKEKNEQFFEKHFKSDFDQASYSLEHDLESFLSQLEPFEKNLVKRLYFLDLLKNFKNASSSFQKRDEEIKKVENQIRTLEDQAVKLGEKGKIYFQRKYFKNHQEKLLKKILSHLEKNSLPKAKEKFSFLISPQAISLFELYPHPKYLLKPEIQRHASCQQAEMYLDASRYDSKMIRFLDECTQNLNQKGVSQSVENILLEKALNKIGEIKSEADFLKILERIKKIRGKEFILEFLSKMHYEPLLQLGKKPLLLNFYKALDPRLFQSDGLGKLLNSMALKNPKFKPEDLHSLFSYLDRIGKKGMMTAFTRSRCHDFCGSEINQPQSPCHSFCAELKKSPLFFKAFEEEGQRDPIWLIQYILREGLPQGALTELQQIEVQLDFFKKELEVLSKPIQNGMRNFIFKKKQIQKVIRTLEKQKRDLEKTLRDDLGEGDIKEASDRFANQTDRVRHRLLIISEQLFEIGGDPQTPPSAFSLHSTKRRKKMIKSLNATIEALLERP